eukprot:SAG25_NODE_8791_length_404_cov_0.678689_1_plen_68_part_00
MVQYTLDGMPEYYAKTVCPADQNSVERTPTGDSEYFWVPGYSANGCMWAAGGAAAGGGRGGGAADLP